VIKPEEETEYGAYGNGTSEEPSSCGYARDNNEYHADDNDQPDRMCGENSHTECTIWSDGALVKNWLGGIMLTRMPRPSISRRFHYLNYIPKWSGANQGR
jgi:hypothetical protein